MRIDWSILPAWGFLFACGAIVWFVLKAEFAVLRRNKMLLQDELNKAMKALERKWAREDKAANEAAKKAAKKAPGE